MSSKEIKIVKQLAAEGAGSFIKSIADILGDNPEGDPSFYGVDLQDYRKIKMDLKREGDQFTLKIKIKYSAPIPGSSEEDTGTPMKYKELKKQMKSTFKALKDSIAVGKMPGRDVVDTFMEQAEMMVSFTGRGYGDEYYEEFKKLCHDFKQISNSGDLVALIAAFNAIDARKALCHEKYD